MNWYKRYKKASFQKAAYPYSSNLCPRCNEPLMLDFYWEKHKRNIGLGLGHCPYCKAAIKADLIPYKKIENKEEMQGFRFSNLTVISEKEYTRLKTQTPDILITKDEDHMATEQPQMGDHVNQVDYPDPMEGQEGNTNMPSTQQVAAFSILPVK